MPTVVGRFNSEKAKFPTTMLSALDRKLSVITSYFVVFDVHIFYVEMRLVSCAANLNYLLGISTQIAIVSSNEIRPRLV